MEPSSVEGIVIAVLSMERKAFSSSSSLNADASSGAEDVLIDLFSRYGND